MSNTLIANLVAWLHWGCEREPSHMLKRKIFHVNASALIAICSMLLFAVLDVSTRNPALIRGVELQLPFYLVFLAVPWLNRQGYVELARWVLALSITAAVALVVWLASGTWLNLHFYFVLFVPAAVVFFPLRQWPAILALVLLNSALFAYCEAFGVDPAPELLMLDPGVVTAFRITAVVASLFTVAFIAWLGEYAAARNEKELEDLSGVDMLTRLPNRRRLEQRLAEKIAVSKRTGKYGAVMFLDLDNFKPVNDVHGHEAGDLLLQEVAQRISNCVREMDMVARFGGDEFVVLLSDLGLDREEAKNRAAAVAKKILESLAQPYRIMLHLRHGKTGYEQHVCTSSIGIQLFSGGFMKEDDLLKRADLAMYKAKEGGRNAIVFHEDERHAWPNPEVIETD
jgi:diguanylate cyclase (GGDEF)-like protein